MIHKNCDLCFENSFLKRGGSLFDSVLDYTLGYGRVPDYPTTRPENLIPEATRTRKIGSRATRARPEPEVITRGYPI